MSGRAGVDGEHLVSVRVVHGFACRLEKAAAERDGALAGSLDVIDVQVEVDLLLLCAGRPLWRDVVWRALNPHDPFAIDHDAVPIVVTMHGAAKQTCPEAA